jgi:hypothetical protein
MKKVVVGNNAGSKAVIIGEDVTVRQCFEDNEVDYGVGMIQFSGYTLRNEDLDTTIGDLAARFGLGDSVSLMVIVKTNNA